jgi:hypothetical protein
MLGHVSTGPRARRKTSMTTAPRRMLLVDHHRGLIEADVPSDEVASAIGRHHAAIRQFLETGDQEPLRPFVAKWFPIAGGTFIPETNPGRLVQLGYSGDLGYDDIYVLE